MRTLIWHNLAVFSAGLREFSMVGQKISCRPSSSTVVYESSRTGQKVSNHRIIVDKTVEHYAYKSVYSNLHMFLNREMMIETSVGIPLFTVTETTKLLPDKRTSLALIGCDEEIPKQDTHKRFILDHGEGTIIGEETILVLLDELYRNIVTGIFEEHKLSVEWISEFDEAVKRIKDQENRYVAILIDNRFSPRMKRVLNTLPNLSSKIYVFNRVGVSEDRYVIDCDGGRGLFVIDGFPTSLPWTGRASKKTS